MEFAGPRRGGGTAGGGKGQKVSYVSQDEPSFIKKFKQRIGFKEEPGVDAKRSAARQENGDESDDDRPEQEDEQPTVVVLRSGDLTAEEAQKLATAAEAEAPVSGKMIFKKPTKRTVEEEPTSSETSAVFGAKNKKIKISNSETNSDGTSNKIKKQLANAKLLSFNDDEEEDV